MTSDVDSSPSNSTLSNAAGDNAPSMLPNMSNPLAGGFIVAVASVSNLGLFIPLNGLGVGGCAPYLR
jgi:hypothetical protein